MTPDWTSDDGSVALYCGDCLKVLPTLSGVDAVVTDPPYNKVNRETGGLRQIDKGGADSLPVDIPQLARELVRLVGGSIYVWCGTEQVSEWRKRFVASGMTTRQGVWEKSNPSPMNGQHLWLSSVELCVFARKSGAVFNRHCASPVWRGPSRRTTEHKTEKPLWLINEQVEASTNEGDSSLDPFMGSGTTGVACVKTVRKFIGIEIDPGYFEIAKKRIQKAISEKAEQLVYGEVAA
jgi:site-specific DNA-methyltransferase (adenine-specific)